MGVLFEKWLHEIDRKFPTKGRSIAIVIYSCPTHSHIENLNSIKLFFATERNMNKTAYGSTRYHISES